ncbi:MAG: transcriptional regulator [Prevotella sp.]|nr:transcriptional regulator [Prevotella sp.]
MLYKIAHIIRDKFSWLWDIIEYLNSFLFNIRYGKKLENIDFKNIPEGYEVTPINTIETKRMVEFFARQPEDAFKFFHPHGFDEKNIKKLQKNKAFLGYVLLDKLNNKIAGYCFNRCFFHGQGFRGRMVDIEYRGKGLGTTMNKLLNEVGFGIGVRLFETVSKDNVASYRSALSASNVRVVKDLPDNELYLEIIKE